jgi:predicted transcriptional regulator
MAKPRVKTKSKALGKLTAVRLDTEVVERLKEIGVEMDRSPSWLIRHAINQFVMGYKSAEK